MNDDLFPAATPADVPLDDQIECVEREIAMRRHVYPRRIEQGRMTDATAAREVLRMEAVLATLRRVRHDATTPDPLGEALNNGER